MRIKIDINKQVWLVIRDGRIFQHNKIHVQEIGMADVRKLAQQHGMPNLVAKVLPCLTANSARSSAST